MRETLFHITSQCGSQETDLDSDLPGQERTPGGWRKGLPGDGEGSGDERESEKVGKDKWRKEHRRSPGDKKVWNMQELSEAGALGEGRKEKGGWGVSRSPQEPTAGVPHL